MKICKRNGMWLSLVASLLTAGCSAPPPVEVPVGAPPDFPADRYAVAGPGETIYAIDGARSLVRSYAYRGGALKRMGHDHVIASRDVTGYLRRVSAGDTGRTFEGDFFVALAAMTVDEPDLRREAGFDTEPSEDDRAGTRGNMLKSLDAATFPFVRARVTTSATSSNEVTADLQLTLHGMTRTLSIPVTVMRDGDTLSASGRFTLEQTDFGISPFSVLGGALAVQDTIEIRFELFAVETDS